MARLIMDIQHSGKPGRRNERGAAADLDGDGKVAVWETEAALTPVYAASATQEAMRMGHQACILATGWYSHRHRLANILAKATNEPCLYVACHMNAGGGDYGLVVHDSRSKAGASAALAVATALLPFWESLGIRPLPPQETSDGHPQWPRVFPTIDGIYGGPSNIAAVCLEPLFMDTHANVITWENLEGLGICIARGFDAWAREQA